MVSELARRAEEARDLRRQLGGLTHENEMDIIFKETSPAREIVPLYSMEDGSTVYVFKYRIDAMIGKTMENGMPRFTSDPSRAPVFHQGTVKCFLAADSPERDILEVIGIHKVCKSEHLANEFARTQHAQRKHKSEWATYQAHIEAQERQDDRALRREEVKAMQQMAAAATGQPVKRSG